MTSDTNVTIGDGGATDYTSFGIDGTLTLIGTARVTKKNTLQLNSMTVDISGTPAIIAYGAGDPVLEINNGVTSIKCVASLSVGKYFGTSFDIPLDYDENGKIVVLLKKVATGQVETMSGSYLINKVGQAPDLVSTSFVTQTLDDSDTNLQEIEFDVIAGDLPTAGDTLSFQLRREDVTNVNDFYIYGIWFSYTSNKLGQ